ncbi:chromosome segregation protein SMC [Coraliomargarita sp. SDUM461004]|uniref:Chromosome partition protein Smc n=1 Tax=Thalassobacterium sedimentorum TaxID=3041258 RepID=A0ABU1AKH0_9BACT|nr:chromosome segregation protein SMC [Coraliomargarita sp. SDUM461004]MDQ8194673.1 chromosome segregation protein SMC [Coraliomargarita sp. SDUM461004]
MYLKEIVISGFKSFADRTRLDLRQGVTAVVGPNGCGKSNIVDAIRWVLGEQSAKALRGASMQDVIFEGTDKRKGLPTCEVTLTFTDCEAELGTQFNEVAIARRVTRDGGSDYYINGKVSRLKDIQRLFANTGVGRVSYSFMLQGQIDQILSTNPAERRTIFEEAAGITLYKAQRKEALSKLALVDANLARVTDVIDEVSRQIGSLKRQASKALRYQRIKHRLTHLDLAFSAYRHSDLSQSIQKLAERAAELRKQVEVHTGSLERDESILMEKKAQRAGLSQKMEELQQRVANLRSEKEHAENQSEFSVIRSKDMVARIAEYQKEIADLEEQKSALAERAKDESENKQLQLDVVDDSDRIFHERNNELVYAQEQLSAMEGQLQKRRQDLLAAENRINRARSRCTTLEVDLRTYQVKHASLTESAASLKEEVVGLEQGLAEIQRLLERRRAEQAASEQAVEQARGESREITAQYRSVQERIQEQDRGVARKSAQLNVLESLQAKFEGFGEGAKAILGDKLSEVVSKDDISIISKELTVDSTYTTALKTLLGTAADTLYIGDAQKALAVIGQLDTNFLGRACLQIDLPAATAIPEPIAVAELQTGIVTAQSVVTVRDPQLQNAVERLLQGCYFVDRLDLFIEYWQSHPNFSFLFAATRDGEIIDCRGLIHGGRTSGKKSASVLERESEIRSLRKEIEVERTALQVLREEADALDERRNVAEAIVEEQRKRLGDLASEVSGLVAEERNQTQKIEQNARTRTQAEDEIDRLDAKHGDSLAELEAARDELAGAEQGLKDERQGGTDLEAAIDLARQERDLKREALSDVRLELAEKKQRLESADRALSEVQRETANLQHRILRRNQEIDTINEQIVQLQQTSAHQASKSEELAKTLAIASDELDKDREQLQGIDAIINEIDEGLSGRRNESRSFDKELTKLEIRLAEERSQLGFIQSTALDEYQVDLSQVNWKAELWEGNVEFEKRVNLDDLDDPDKLSAQPKHERRDPTEEELAEMDATNWTSIEEEVSELKSRISNMGPVNLDAISEYTDLKERHDFLKGQSEDLWNSKNSLVETIEQINETSQTLFRETFEQVKKNFAFTYGKISGGGDSDLKLVDSEDPLESGIDIIARPPGTRLKSVTLLSGGQRTMAAVALLFAIYMVKPSPFCVLDEIDAALDDANIGRFCDTLHGFTDKSQFLIITHNKRTISNADTVFGVTMPEKGVSTLLSMRFNKDSKRPEMAAEENQQPF